MIRVVKPFDPNWWKRPVIRQAKSCEGCGTVCQIDVRMRPQWKLCVSCRLLQMRSDQRGQDVGVWPA